MNRSVRYYTQTAHYEQLKSRVIELNHEGKTYAEIARHLNAEGFQPAKRAEEFNKKIVGRLAKKFLPGIGTSRKASSDEAINANEWYLNNLVAELGIPRNTLISWMQRGWLHLSRQLPGYRGKLVFWADAAEIDRLRRLRQIKWNFGDPPIPSELTTPVVPQAKETKGKCKNSEDCQQLSSIYQ